MNDGIERKICDLKVGDILYKNNEITAFIKVDTKGSQMYSLNNIIVSDSHIVKYNDKWIPVSGHPKALKISSYDKPYLYCLNTSNKTIEINNLIFTDWDEIYSDKDINKIINNKYCKIGGIKDIHTYLDGGFDEFTQIKLIDGKIKIIRDILVGDILENGEKVYGLVKINGHNMKSHFIYNLGTNSLVKGGSNLSFNHRNSRIIHTLSLGNNKKILINNHKILYHLLTDTKTFYIGDILFNDYNASIDLLLEK
jgi:hypothetical protein